MRGRGSSISTNGLRSILAHTADVLSRHLHDEHYDVITQVPAFFGRVYYCDGCDKAYSNKDQHLCNRGKCSGCNSANACPFLDWRHFSWFVSLDCYLQHQLGGMSMGTKKQKMMSICDRIKRCCDCGVILQSGYTKRHKCGHFYCETCRQNIKREGHQCYIRPIQDTAWPKKPRFIFFDFETRQDIEFGYNKYGPRWKHAVNCCVAYRICDDCKMHMTGDCNQCGGSKRHVFLGDNTLEQFGRWLFSEANRGATALAHNAHGFDGQFLLDYPMFHGVPGRLHGRNRHRSICNEHHNRLSV